MKKTVLGTILRKAADVYESDQCDTITTEDVEIFFSQRNEIDDIKEAIGYLSKKISKLENKESGKIVKLDTKKK